MLGQEKIGLNGKTVLILSCLSRGTLQYISITPFQCFHQFGLGIILTI